MLKKKQTKTNIEPPVQLSIWDILEHPLFEKNLQEEIKLLKYTGENYEQLKLQVEQQYKKDLSILELAKDNSMKELLKDYDTPEELTVKYIEVITKKAELSSHKRDLIKRFFEPIIKGTAINIINEKSKKQCAESSSQKDPSQSTGLNIEA